MKACEAWKAKQGNQSERVGRRLRGEAAVIERYAARVDWYSLWIDAEIREFLSGRRRR